VLVERQHEPNVGAQGIRQSEDLRRRGPVQLLSRDLAIEHAAPDPAAKPFERAVPMTGFR